MTRQERKMKARIHAKLRLYGFRKRLNTLHKKYVKDIQLEKALGFIYDEYCHNYHLQMLILADIKRTKAQIAELERLAL